MSIRKSSILMTCIFLAQCKTTSSNPSGSLLDAATSEGSPAEHGVLLERFSHELDKTAIRELGSRLGCDAASQWMSYPRSGSVRESIAAVRASDMVYETVLSEFFYRNAVRDVCLEGGEPQRKSNDHGIRRLLSYVKAQDPNAGITVIMAGGFGSHIGVETSLDESVDAWDQVIDELDDDSLAIWQLECSNSFAPDQRCAREFIDVIKEREERFPRTTKHKYLLWGYSKGGNTILEALRQSRDLRNKTLAVLTNGSPLGGSSTMIMLYPAIEKVANSVSQTTQRVMEFANAQPWAYLMTPAAYLVDNASVAAKIAKLLTPEELAQVTAGADEMKPSSRKQYLYGTVKGADYSRDDGVDIPVFHSAALVDIATMQPWPLLTTDGDKLIFAKDSFSTDHMGELGFTPVMRDFPLNDSCVALEHSVIPMDAVPAGLTSELIALFAFDHSAHRLTPLPYEKWDVPHLEIVDTLIETVAMKLEARTQ